MADAAYVIMSVVKQTQPKSTFQATLCDGKNKLPGRTSALRKTEEQLGRPQQWLVCQLQMNKLPFRKYFSRVDKENKQQDQQNHLGTLLK